MQTKFYLVATHCADEANARATAKSLQEKGQSCVVYEMGSDLADRIATYWADGPVDEHGTLRLVAS